MRITDKIRMDWIEETETLINKPTKFGIKQTWHACVCLDNKIYHYHATSLRSVIDVAMKLHYK